VSFQTTPNERASKTNLGLGFVIFSKKDLRKARFLENLRERRSKMKKTRREFMKMVGGTALGSGVMLAGSGKVARAAPKGVPSEPIKIGIICFLSGIAAPVGEPGWRATQIWVDDCNAVGGILGRKIELHLEEETSAKETVERFKKLTLQTRCDVIMGIISTGNGQAIAPVAEDFGQLWLSWDGTTQKGVEETMPKTKYAFKSCNNESEAVGGAILTAKHFPDVRTVAGINPDYSYGRNCWEAYKTVLKHFNPRAEFVLDLWPKLGTADFTSHIAAIKKAKPDILMSSMWSGDSPILFKQAAAVGLFREMKACFTTAALVHESLKKEFTPEGMILGYNSLYFNWTDSWPLLRDFTRKYYARFKSYPYNESDHAYFVLEAYKTAVEKAYAFTGKWPTKEQIAKVLTGIQVATPAGYRGYAQDNRMLANYFMGISTHKNPYDFATIDRVEVLSPAQIQTPPGMKFHDWVGGWGK
jgi:branched-chain amino acid transport system substrate-binding protein